MSILTLQNYVLYQISHMAVNFIHHLFTKQPSFLIYNPYSFSLSSFYFHCYEIRFIFWKIPKFILWKFNCVDADILYECLQTFMKKRKMMKNDGILLVILKKKKLYLKEKPFPHGRIARRWVVVFLYSTF